MNNRKEKRKQRKPYVPDNPNEIRIGGWHWDETLNRMVRNYPQESEADNEQSICEWKLLPVKILSDHQPIFPKYSTACGKDHVLDTFIGGYCLYCGREIVETEAEK